MELPDPVEDALEQALILGLLPIADPPVAYRAYEGFGTRFAWTLPPLRFRLWRHIVPGHYTITLKRGLNGAWGISEIKAFETTDEARRWAGYLWRDAARAASRG